jgi:osmotically-inducible protein OsmY
MLKLIFGAAAGFAAAWFFDPNDGTRRRHLVRDKALKYARRSKDEAVRRSSYVAGQVKGKATEAAPGTGREAAGERLNDPALQAKIESEVFRSADAPKDKVSINVEKGVAYLRGEVADRDTIESLVQAVAKVEGVRGVDNLLHAPGEPAPAKDESRHTAGTTSA